MKPIKNYPEILDQYLISEDGLVYSLIKNRYLKGQYNSSGDKMYYLKQNDGGFKWYMANRMVAFTYLPLPMVQDRLNLKYRDGDKTNIHYTNLEWVTHSSAILLSIKNPDRISYWSGLKRCEETKLLMSNAKKKRITIYRWGKQLNTYESIESLCLHMSWSRRNFNRILNGQNKKSSKQFTFKFVDDIIVQHLT